MRFLDLGPLAVEIDGAPRTLGGRRVESVAAALLVNVGAPLPAATLIDAVWGADPPAGAGGALDSLIWRLRRVLEPGRAARDAALVRRDEQGYRLTVAPDTIDSHVLTATAAAADGTANADDALRIADDALGRWRGTPYDGVPDTGWLEPVRTRLAEVRVTLQQHRLDVLLATGQPDRVVTDLVPLLVEHPYRESLWERKLRALYAAGRQQAALAAFHELRRALAEELGVEPGPRLRRLHQQILAHDPALQPRAEEHVTRTAAPARAVEVHLPRRGNRFVGRDDERRGLADRLAADRIVTLTGPGGCGKTRLAIEAAGEAREHFPDGVWFVDLSAVADADPGSAERVAARVAATLGLDPGPRRSALDALCDFAAERAVLLLLDNCEQVVEGAATTVDALVEAAQAVAVLATSRQPLGVDGEMVQTLAPLALPAADTPAARAASPAVALFLERIRARGEPADLDGPDGPAITRICAAVDGLPLGIELAAARVGTFTLAEIADGLGANRARCPGWVAGRPGSGTCTRRSTGATASPPPTSGPRTAGSPCCPGRSRWTPPRPSVRSRPCGPDRRSTSSAAWPTGRSSPPHARHGPVARPGSASSTPSGHTRGAYCASPARRRRWSRPAPGGWSTGWRRRRATGGPGRSPGSTGSTTTGPRSTRPSRRPSIRAHRGGRPRSCRSPSSG